jgi:hypothetical protein
MKTEDLVPVKELCIHYKIEYSFFDSLYEYGLVEIINEEQSEFILKENLSEVERMIRLHSDLGINLEGIEAISHLLKKVDELQKEILYLKNRYGDGSVAD